MRKSAACTMMYSNDAQIYDRGCSMGGHVADFWSVLAEGGDLNDCGAA
jgi:hypothetical protein